MKSACLLLLVVAASCVTAPPHSPISAKQFIEVSSDTERLSCYGRRPGDRFGSRLGRTAVAVGPEGAHRAYAEVRATATEWQDGAKDCRNVSTLYLAGPDEREFRVAFEQNPGAEGKTGNSLEIVDWSPDGERLLMELTTWTYPTDVENPLIVVYNVATGTVQELPIYSLLTEKYPGKCFVAIRALGWTPQGQVVVESSPYRGTGALPQPSCTSDTVVWMFHPAPPALEALPQSYRVIRYAK